MTPAKFLETHKPAFKVIPIDFRPDRTMAKITACCHFTFRLEYRDREYVGFFSQVSKAKQLPSSVSSVLECLQSDCQTGDNTYREFASEYGYNADLSEGYQTWQTCRATRNGLIDLFGRGVFRDFMELEFSE